MTIASAWLSAWRANSAATIALTTMAIVLSSWFIAEAIARDLEPSAWVRLSAGQGTKGARRYDWAYLELADLEADAFNPALVGTWTRGLLIRRNLPDGELAFFST